MAKDSLAVLAIETSTIQQKKNDENEEIVQFCRWNAMKMYLNNRQSYGIT